MPPSSREWSSQVRTSVSVRLWHWPQNPNVEVRTRSINWSVDASSIVRRSSPATSVAGQWT
ncbi:hypothetical protein BRC81_06980 [Halobacteriales archaeon QS_1_68_20]|nr:MAG: hypothetical protein BRC81_06980 [Halobacteriales archaeon QS_1_68_20]